MSKMQEFMKQSPDKQLDMMKKALEMQKTMAKVPGVGRLAAKNVEMMEKLLKMQEQSVQGKPPSFETQAKMEAEVKSFLADRAGQPAPPPPPSSSASTSNRNAPKGPTLDELKRLNLGSEIEALFEEIRTIRQRKNHYRDLYHQREKEHEESTKEAARLRGVEETLRSKLQLAEQNVMLLNSEGMELKENVKKLKTLQTQNSELTHRVAALSRNDTQPLLKKIEALEHEAQARQEHIRSLQRKLDRLRLRDPLQSFSVAAVSDVLRLSGSAARSGADEPSPGSGAANDAASSTANAAGSPSLVNPVTAAFEILQAQYDQSRRAAWESAATSNAAAAKVLIASSASLLASHIPYSTLDAMITVQGNLATARIAFAAMGIALSSPSGSTSSSSTAEQNVFIASLAADSPTPVALGPYGFAVAVHLCTNALADFGFAITATHPMLTETLMKNPNRTTLTYDTSRSGGPGGQAANVAETQVNARLKIDGNVLQIVSESQDSRSALANKQSATERLYDTRRVAWNKSISSKQKLSEVVAEIRSAIRSGNTDDGVSVQRTSGGSGSTKLAGMKEYVPFVRSAWDAKQVTALEVAVVDAIQSVA